MMRQCTVFLLLGLLGELSASVMAQEAVIIADDRQEALQACENMAAEAPEKARQNMLQSCRCIVEHLDFAKVAELSQNGREEELKKLQHEAVAACKEQ